MNDNEKSYIEKLEDTYRQALSLVDTEAEQLISGGKEMQGLMVFNNCLLIMGHVYELLNDIYEIVFNGQYLLSKSKRFKNLGYELAMTSRIRKSMGIDHGAMFEDMEDLQLASIFETGVTKKEHIGISSVVLTEIEYMIKTLKILVEPDFVPLSEVTIDEKPESDRYIPKSVKIAVWQRDLVKCVECGSKEKLEYDHIIPVTKGGSNTERNIQLLCEKCNRQKSGAIQ